MNKDFPSCQTPNKSWLESPALWNDISGVWHAQNEQISTPQTYGSDIYIYAVLKTGLFMQQTSYIARAFESPSTLIKVN